MSVCQHGLQTLGWIWDSWGEWNLGVLQGVDIEFLWVEEVNFEIPGRG